jgi:hypothetical protein
MWGAVLIPVLTRLLRNTCKLRRDGHSKENDACLMQHFKVENIVVVAVNFTLDGRRLRGT